MIIENLYQTKIECTNDTTNEAYYNVNIDATNVRVTVSLIDFNGNVVKGKPVTLTVDKGTITSVKSPYTGNVATGGKSATGKTGDDGKFIILYTASEWGLCTFSANSSNIQIDVDGWRTKTSSVGTLRVNEKLRLAELWGGVTTSGIQRGVLKQIGTYDTNYRPKLTIMNHVSHDSLIQEYVVINETTNAIKVVNYDGDPNQHWVGFYFLYYY